MIVKEVYVNVKIINTFKYDYFPRVLLYLTIEIPKQKAKNSYLRYKTITSQNVSSEA